MKSENRVTEPEADDMALVGFKLAWDLGELLIHKGIISPEEMRAMRHAAADSMHGDKYEKARDFLKKLAG